jgi:hypothetical protein
MNYQPVLQSWFSCCGIEGVASKKATASDCARKALLGIEVFQWRFKGRSCGP